MTKVFIDGSEGTTGLRIHERFADREDLEILSIDPEKRKDPAERKRLLNACDVAFLCLPDDAARESAELVDNENTVIIDASTAHRTSPGWVYGFPELRKEQRDLIQKSRRIAVPGCYATGFISLVYPMIASGFLGKDYPVSSFALSGYSGAGKKAIAVYESPEKPLTHFSPREYALSQQHKHLKEMQAVTGLDSAPLFSPVVDDYYSGMFVTVPLYTKLLNSVSGPKDIHRMFAEYYADQSFIHVMPFGSEEAEKGFLSANTLSGYDDLRIYVTGNEDRILLTSLFDNLGKGASGAAVQCLNLVLGCEETKGLHMSEVNS
ncbi:MAG: N-acetyl-gamma-glutamyl-phosphate reductase [Lachnospiraceae bacterium]|nr:N-acetyl-gamma-glutamyl-phosphate reductase [Lachnospiraceae bacterium]